MIGEKNTAYEFSSQKIYFKGSFTSQTSYMLGKHNT